MDFKRMRMAVTSVNVMKDVSYLRKWL